MAYLTPPDIPEDADCRSLQIPASSYWLAIVSGALSELSKPYNWEYSGGATVEETLAAVQTMLDAYYNVPCGEGCELPETPGGKGIIRRTEDGITQQIIDGTWTTPEGVYTPLPPEPREEATDEEKRCIAALNAVYALKLTYEEVQTDWEAFQDVASAIDVFITIIEVAMASFGAYMAAGLLELGQFLFQSVLQLFAEIAEDTFDEAEQDLYCIFYDNATVGMDDRVSFDFAAIRERLFADFVIGQIFTGRSTLGLQLDYFLYYIGAETLNYSGGLEVITEGDCTCDCTVYNDDMVSSAGVWDHEIPYAGINNAWNGTTRPGVWQNTGGRTTGGCWGSAIIGNFGSPSLSRRNAAFVVDLGSEMTVSDAAMWVKYASNGNASSRQITYYGADLTVRRNYQPVASTSTDWALVADSTLTNNVRYIRFSCECITSQNTDCFIDDVSFCYLP